METINALGQKRGPGKTVARLSIVTLALGFSLLGVLSLLNKHQVCGESGLTFENAFVYHRWHHEFFVRRANSDRRGLPLGSFRFSGLDSTSRLADRLVDEAKSLTNVR
jgi:hypothetical protein